jgi:hypothetical protein
MEFHFTIIEVTGGVFPWAIVVAFAVLEVGILFLLLLFLPAKRKALAWLVLIPYFLVFPWAIRYSIEAIMSDRSNGTVACAHFFHLPLYYPAIIATTVGSVFYWQTHKK